MLQANPERQQPHPTEHPDSSFSESDDHHACERTLRESMHRADELILKYDAGEELTEREKTELSSLTRQLRRLLNAQMGPTIHNLDMADGTYNNARVDNELRVQLRRIRNMDIQLNGMFGTRTVQKFSALLTEDVPNLVGVKWLQLKNGMWQISKALVLGTAVAGTALVAGYGITGMAMGDGFWGGMQNLGRHAGGLFRGAPP